MIRFGHVIRQEEKMMETSRKETRRKTEHEVRRPYYGELETYKLRSDRVEKERMKNKRKWMKVAVEGLGRGSI